MLLDGRKSLRKTNLSGKVHLLEEVMVFFLSPPPAKYKHHEKRLFYTVLRYGL